MEIMQQYESDKTEVAVSVKEVLEELRLGRFVVVQDDEHRENEADLVMAAEFVQPEAIAFMARHGCGLICVALTSERLRQLDLPLMPIKGRRGEGTKFCLSVDHVDGGTGISSVDRSATVQALLKGDAKDLFSPGHMFPLRADDRGLRGRMGHTEATIELMRLANLSLAGVLCEILDVDGVPISYALVEEYLLRYNLKRVRVRDILTYMDACSIT